MFALSVLELINFVPATNVMILFQMILNAGCWAKSATDCLQTLCQAKWTAKMMMTGHGSRTLSLRNYRKTHGACDHGLGRGMVALPCDMTAYLFTRELSLFYYIILENY